VKNGVPFNTAFGINQVDQADFQLTKAELTAMQIIFSEQEGAGQFNFDTRDFDKVKP